jgi:sugar lactone lactonase YvrE
MQIARFIPGMRSDFRTLAIALAWVLPIYPVLGEPASITLPSDRAFPENITSTRDGTIYVGSLAGGGVFRILPNSSKADLWIKPGTFGSRSIFGVLADERSNTLWACSNDVSALGVNVPGTDKGSTLKGFDLKTGEGKVSATLPGAQTLCNDIAIGPDGSAYVTNTLAPEILKLSADGKELSVWLSDVSLGPPAGGYGLDGIAFGSDGNLYVDRFTPGDVFRIAVRNGKPGKVTMLKLSRSLELTDAIRPLGDNRFLIVEGAGRVDQMTVAGDSAAIETIKGGFAGPTGATRGLNGVAWVSEGQLSFVLDPSKKGRSPSLPFHIYSVVLPKP